MDIKQLKINGISFYPKVPMEAIVSIDPITGEETSDPAVDTTVQPNSDNLVTSGAVYNAIQNSAMTVDDALNANSTNPVQNRVINGAIGGLQQSISGVSSQLNNKLSSSDLKTVNGQSLVGSGDITITPGSDVTVDDALSTTSTNPVQNKIVAGEIANLQYQITETADDLFNYYYTKTSTDDLLSAKQERLESGTNIKTINGQTILGNGDITISGGGSTTTQVKSITLDDNRSASLVGEGSIYLQGLDGIKTAFNNNVISLYLEDQFKVDMQSALETAAQSLNDVGDLEERVAALEAIEPGGGGTSPSVYLKSITKNGNTYTIKDQANTETSWTIPTIPTIPTVNNSTVTFAIADAEHPAGGSFTLNQATNATIYLPASTGEGGTTYIENPFDISQHSITELSDVDTSGTKDDGYTLVYNQSNGKWVPAAPFGGSLGSLSNVTITSPAEGQVLKFTGQKWENGTISAGIGDENVIEIIKVNNTALTPDSNKAVNITIPNLNISTATPTTGQVLKWNGTQWAPATDNASSSTMNLNDINDVSAGDASDGQVLMYYAGDWLNRNIVLNEIGDVNTTGATEGQVLKYNGNKWVPAADNAGSSTTVTPSVKTFDINVNQLNSYKVSGEEKFKYFCLKFPITQSGSNYLFDCKNPIKVDVQYFDTNYDRTDTAFASFVLNAGFVFTSSAHYGWKNVYNVYNDGAKYISAGANIAGSDSIVKYINPAPDVYEWIISRDTNNNPCILFPIGINKSFDNTIVQLKVTVSGLPSDGQGDVTVYYGIPGQNDDMSVSLASVNNEIQ